MLNSTANQYVQRVKKAITVATLFYGYGEQIHRYLQGDEILHLLGARRSVTARIASSLPGGYEYPLSRLSDLSGKDGSTSHGKAPHIHPPRAQTAVLRQWRSAAKIAVR